MIGLKEYNNIWDATDKYESDYPLTLLEGRDFVKEG